MVMTVDTAESLKTSGSSVAFCACVPGSGMLAGIYREELGIMRSETGGFPSRVGCMAIAAARREAGCYMIRVCGGIVVGLMAGNTFFRKVRIIPVYMALTAVTNGMAVGQWEKIMIDICCGPGKAE